MMHRSQFPQFKISEYPLMPYRLAKPLFAYFVPSDLRVFPALIFESIGAFLLAWYSNLTAVTVSLGAIQFFALVSSALTHGWGSAEIRKALIQIGHMWLVLAGLFMFGYAKWLPVDLYPSGAGFLAAFEMLIILKNASESGINTPFINRAFELFRAKGETGAAAMVIPSRDPKAISEWDQMQKLAPPIAPMTTDPISQKTEPRKDGA